MLEDLQRWVVDASWLELLATGVDVAVVYYLIYRVLLLIKGTKAVQMLIGLIAIVVVFFASRGDYLNLPTLHWMLDKFIGSFVLIIIVIFQDDIRRGLSQFGQTRLFTNVSQRQDNEVIEEVVKAATLLSARRLGGLMVIQREADIHQFATAGVELDATVSKDLLFSIFLPTHENPLHDGAVVIRRGRIVRAGCFLPLTTNPRIDKALGTRHRAAIGLSEQTDAAIVVVSEETGLISVVYREEILRGLDATAVRDVLQRIFASAAKEEQRSGGGVLRLFKRFERPREEVVVNRDAKAAEAAKDAEV